MSAYRASGGIAPVILNLSTGGGDEWSTSPLGRLGPGKEPRYPGGWVGPTDGLDASEKSRFSYTVGIRNPDRPVRSLVTIPKELLWRLNILPV